MIAGVAELVDARDLKSLGYYTCAGSSPALGTTVVLRHQKKIGVFFLFTFWGFLVQLVFLFFYKSAVKSFFVKTMLDKNALLHDPLMYTYLIFVLSVLFGYNAGRKPGLI